MPSNWPHPDIQTFATRRAQTCDIADALTAVFRGSVTTLTRPARYVADNSSSRWVFGDVAAGTPFVFDAVSNDGDNGLRVSGRTYPGVFFTVFWDGIDARALLNDTQTRESGLGLAVARR